MHITLRRDVTGCASLVLFQTEYCKILFQSTRMVTDCDKYVVEMTGPVVWSRDIFLLSSSVEFYPSAPLPVLASLLFGDICSDIRKCLLTVSIQ